MAGDLLAKALMANMAKRIEEGVVQNATKTAAPDSTATAVLGGKVKASWSSDPSSIKGEAARDKKASGLVKKEDEEAEEESTVEQFALHGANKLSRLMLDKKLNESYVAKTADKFEKPAFPTKLFASKKLIQE